MFEFRYVEMMNWAYWPTMKVPLDQRTIMISGPNGSGKTTFLDGLRTLLRAPRLSANRRFTDYLIGNVDTAVIKAVVTNDYHQRERRPFEFKGFTNELVTLAILMRRRQGRWEKRFAILEGDVPLADLRNLRQSEQVSPETYTYEIGEAGFSHAFLKVLALEQGQTDKLCERSPAQLLDLLLDVHGDKTIIERYKKARENYQVANIEVTQLGARLAEEQAKLLISQRKAEDYRRYRELQTQLAEFEGTLLPQAEYKAGLRRIDEANLAINDLNLRLRPVDREALKIEELLANAETELIRRKNLALQAHETRTEMEKKERALDIQLATQVQERERLLTLLAAAKDAKPESVEPLQRRLAEIQRERARLDIQIEEHGERLRLLRADRANLEQPRGKIHPGYVQEFSRSLQRQGIEHRLLCDIVEITDKSWQLAVESILGRDRFTILVDPSQQLEARKLGERLRYRHYVVARENSRAPARSGKGGNRLTALDVVEFTEDGAPAWVYESLERSQLVEDVAAGMRLGANANSVTRQAYRQDRRGGISIAVEQFYCGSMGQNTRRDELDSELKRVADLARVFDGKQKELAAEARELDQRLRLQADMGKIAEARARKEQLDEQISPLNTQHKEALFLRREADRQVLEATEQLHNFERDLEEQRRELQRLRGDQSEFLEELRDHQESILKDQAQLAGIAQRLTPALLEPKALAKVPSLDELTPQLYAVRNLLARYPEAPDAHAVEIYEHHQGQYDRQRKLYDEHEKGLRSWENEFRLAREKYLVVVEHTIREYRKNVLALAGQAGVAAEVILPDLKADENALENAGLSVRFGFDGKRAVDIGGSSHSGGQRVVASLILLMSLATSGGVNRGGFFIIDEPFAHLSLERIDDVSRFLERTQCQFILTSPTTHNVNVFNAARLLVNFRIKQAGAEYAALPTIIRR